MVGNGLLAFAVLVVVAIFVYLSLRFNRKSDGTEQYEAIYEITLVEGFINEVTEIHLNDSTILNQKIEVEPFTFSIKQFDPEGALLFIDRKADDLSVFNIGSNGGKYTFKKEQNRIKLVEK